MSFQTIEAGKVKQFASDVKAMLAENGKPPSVSASCVLFAAGMCPDMSRSKSKPPPTFPDCTGCSPAYSDGIALVYALINKGLTGPGEHGEIDPSTDAQILTIPVRYIDNLCTVIFSHAGSPDGVKSPSHGIVTLSAQRQSRLERVLQAR